MVHCSRLLSIIFILFATCSWSTSPTQTPAIRRVQAILSSPPFTDTQFRKAITTLTQTIALHPNYNRLILLRANYYVQIAEYKKAREDIQSVIAAGTGTLELKLFNCILTERLDGYGQRARQCYATVAEQYAEEENNRHPPSANRVVAALLAESRKALKLKRIYLSNTSKSDPMRALIKNFNGRAYVRTVLP